jgi:hypothetical protein
MADLTQTAASVLPETDAETRVVTAGGTITAGMAVYRDSADSKYKALDAGGSDNAPAGIALNNASNGQPLAIQTEGDINLGATLIVGECYCVSAANAGKIAPIADVIAGNGNYIDILGLARDASTLAMNLFSVGVPYNE